MSQPKKLKGTNVYNNEHLTPKTADIAKKGNNTENQLNHILAPNMDKGEMNSCSTSGKKKIWQSINHQISIKMFLTMNLFQITWLGR